MEKVIVYMVPSCTTCLTLERILKQNNVPYEIRNMSKNKLTHEQILRLFQSAGDKGIEHVLAIKSKPYKELKNSIDSLTMNELVGLMRNNEKLIKKPIVFHEDNVIQGMDRNWIEMVVGRARNESQSEAI